MTKSEIKVGTEYAYRAKPRPGEPIERVRVLRHARGTQWQVEWINGENRGLKDFVTSQQIVFPWKGRLTYLRLEAKKQRFDEYNEPQYEALGKPVALAIEQAVSAAGEEGLDFDSALVGKPDSIERFATRAGRDPEQELRRGVWSYVDLQGDLHIACEQAHELARAFTMAEPATVLDDVTATEIRWSRDVKEPGNHHLVGLLNQYRAAWAILRQWAGHDTVVADLKARVDRAERIALDAVYILQKAGLERQAEDLRRKLGRG